MFGEFFAEPAHGAVEVVQAEALDALDPVILPPAVGGAIRAARKQAVQNGEENRALQRKIMLARTGEALGDRAATCHKRSNTRAAPIRRAGRRRRLAVGDGAHDDGRVGEARARPQQSPQLRALAQIFQATERGDDLLAHRENMARNRGGDSFVAHTESDVAPVKSSVICDYVAPLFRENATPESIISTICAPHSGRNCRRSVRIRG